MTVRVMAWADPTSLREEPEFKALEEYLHVYATESMRHAEDTSDPPRASCHTGTGLSAVPRISFRLLLKQMMAPWFNVTAQFDQLVELGLVLDGFPNSPVCRSLQRSRREVLEGIRTLILAGMAPSDLTPATAADGMFQDAWQELEHRFPAVNLPREILHGATSETRFTARLSRALETLEQPDPSGRPPKVEGAVAAVASKTLVLPGFYFVTPEQHRFFELASS